MELQASEELQRKLIAASDEWRATFDSIESPIVLLDGDRRLQRVNRAAAELAGMSPAELVGHRVAEVSGDFWRALEALAERAETADSQVRERLVEPGSGRAWSLTVQPPFDTDAGSWRVATATDVTDLLRLREKLRRRETLAAFGSLFANVAHEVRNPLFSISALLETIELRFGETPDLAPYLTSLRQQTERLQGVMMGVLEYGRPGRLDRSLHSPEILAREAMAAVGKKAAARGVRLELLDRARVRIAVDRPRIVRALTHILDNAIEHSSDEGVVTVELEDGSWGGAAQVRFRVRDHGSGFAAEPIERVFEPFFSHRSPGVGLGLAIVERLVELHGGEVRVRNAEEGGAVVEVDLPAEPPATEGNGTDAGTNAGEVRA